MEHVPELTHQMQHQMSVVHTVTTVGSGSVALELFPGSQLTARGKRHAKLPTDRSVGRKALLCP